MGIFHPGFCMREWCKPLVPFIRVKTSRESPSCVCSTRFNAIANASWRFFLFPLSLSHTNSHSTFSSSHLPPLLLLFNGQNCHVLKRIPAPPSSSVISISGLREEAMEGGWRCGWPESPPKSAGLLMVETSHDYRAWLLGGHKLRETRILAPSGFNGGRWSSQLLGFICFRIYRNRNGMARHWHSFE